jgi:ubiquinone/menaquinone biosynthesis C-methylase UbiE
MEPDKSSEVNMALFKKVRPQAANLMGSFAELLLRQAQFPPPTDASGTTLKVLDNACGSGTVTDKIMEALTGEQKQRMFLTCADLSDVMVDGMKEHIAESGWKQVDAVKADAQVRENC